MLMKYFLNRFRRREGKAIEGFSPSVMKALTEYHWPGNVRELENTVERLVVFARDKTIAGIECAYEGPALPEADGTFAYYESTETRGRK